MKMPKDMKGWKKRPDGLWAERYYHKVKKGKSYWTWRLYYEKICEYCGEPLLVVKDRVDREPRRGKYCDQSCAGKANVPRCTSGPTSSNWRGGRIKRAGYIHLWMPQHPNASKRGYVAEHVVVMAKVLGRPLRKGENVHHIDGNGFNNDPSNLRVMRSGEHLAMHRQMKQEQREAMG